MTELWLSLDIETDGPSIVTNSMLSVGMVAYLFDSEQCTYTEGESICVDMKKDEKNVVDQDTLEWWLSDNGNPEEWKRLQTVETTQKEGCERISDWIKGLMSKYNTKPVLVCYPSVFDGGWFDQLFVNQLGKHCPSWFKSYDIRTYASAVLAQPLSKCKKDTLLKEYLPTDAPHTHNALDDAIEQGRLFCNIHAKNIIGDKPFP